MKPTKKSQQPFEDLIKRMRKIDKLPPPKEEQKLLPAPKSDTEIDIETIFLQGGYVVNDAMVKTIAEACRRSATGYYKLPEQVNFVVNSLLLEALNSMVGTRKMAVMRNMFFFGVAIGNLFKWVDRDKTSD